MTINIQEGDLIQITFYNKLGEQAGLNVRHYSAVNGTKVGSPTLTQVAGEVSDIFGVLYKDVMSVEASYRGVGAKVLKPAQTLEVYSINQQGNGSYIGDPLPTQTRGIITLRTNLAGPRNRGRVYVPFPSEDANDSDGRPDTTYFSFLDNLATNLDDVVSINDGAGNEIQLTPVVYSRKFDTVQAVTGHTTRTRWGTQRSSGAYGSTNLLPI